MLMAILPNALCQLINIPGNVSCLIGHDCFWIADLLSYSMTRGTLHYYIIPSTLFLAPSWPILLLPATQCLVPLWPKLLLPAMQYLVPYCFCQLRMSRAFVAETAFSGYAMSCAIRYDHFCQLLMSCAFMAKTTLLTTRCLAMSCALCHTFFSPLLYWCLAWQCSVPVGATFAGNQITT